jgi:hypothetical protein
MGQIAEAKDAVDRAGLTEAEALAAIFAVFERPALARGEFTVDMVVAARPNVPRNTVRGRLNRMVESGALSKRDIWVDGRKCNAYRWRDGTEATVVD